MPVSNIDIPDFGGTSRNVNTLPSLGRVAATSSLPVTLSTEDAAYLDGLETALSTIDGRVDGLETLLTSLDGKGLAKTVTTSAYARPADTNTYAVDDCWSTSTSAPANTSFASLNRATGKSVQICGLTVIGSVHNATAPLQAELWLFDAAPTAVNDNANHALSDADAAKVVARIPFALSHNMANNDVGFGDFSLSGFPVVTLTATDLYAQVRVKNAYVPSSAETLTFRLQVIQID